MPNSRSRYAKAATVTVALFVVSLVGGPHFARAQDVGSEVLNGATFTWSINDESNTGAFNGQCNFITAGISDGSAGTYRATDGNLTVLKLNAAGKDEPISDYSTRCKDANGKNVTPGGSNRLGQKVQFSNGVGTRNPATGAVSIQWTGTFSLNYYGQLTPFWFTDPHLNVGADGKGVITATMGGYASSIDNPEERHLVEPVPGVIVATLSGVNTSSADGFVHTPDYFGVVHESTELPQIRFFPNWGAWPSSFLSFMESLGLGGYWYTTGGAADVRKAPDPVVIGYGTSSPPTTAPTTSTTAPPTSTTTIPGSSTTTSTTTTTTTVPAPSTTTTTTTVPGSWSGAIGISAVVPQGPPPVLEDGEEEVEENPDPLPEDAFIWTIDASSGQISLGLVPGTGEYRFAGELRGVQVIDTRSSAPGWSVSGQVGDFSGGVPGRYLGWTPRILTEGAGALPGESVISGFLAGNGLSNPSLLASAPKGHPIGSATVGADLDLRLPTATPAGTYTATLTLTALG